MKSNEIKVFDVNQQCFVSPVVSVETSALEIAADVSTIVKDSAANVIHVTSETMLQVVSVPTYTIQLRDGQYIADDVLLDEIGASVTGGGFVYVDKGSLKTTGKKPSEAHDWDTKKQAWVENKPRSAELAQAQAQADAEKKIKEMTKFVEHYLDSTAQSFGFDDIKTAALRASFTGSPLQPIGMALGVWMDKVWLKCKGLLEQWQRGEIDEPTIDTLRAALPPAPTQA
jgi:hypothetical protein